MDSDLISKIEEVLFKIELTDNAQYLIHIMNNVDEGKWISFDDLVGNSWPGKKRKLYGVLGQLGLRIKHTGHEYKPPIDGYGLFIEYGEPKGEWEDYRRLRPEFRSIMRQHPQKFISEDAEIS